MFDGSAVASTRVELARFTSTVCFWATSSAISSMTARSISNSSRLIEGTPYCFATNSVSSCFEIAESAISAPRREPLVRAPSRAARSCCAVRKIFFDEELADPPLHLSLRALDPRPGCGAIRPRGRIRPEIRGFLAGGSARRRTTLTVRLRSRVASARIEVAQLRAQPAQRQETEAGSREPEDRVQERAGGDGGFRRESEALQHQFLQAEW